MAEGENQLQAESSRLKATTTQRAREDSGGPALFLYSTAVSYELSASSYALCAAASAPFQNGDISLNRAMIGGSLSRTQSISDLVV